MTCSRLRLSGWLAAAVVLAAGCSSEDPQAEPAPIAGSDAGSDAAPDQEADGEIATEAGPDVEVDAPLDPRFEVLAEHMEEERVALGAPGAAIAIVQGGHVTWSAGFGTKDPDATVPVSDTTLFRIGSVTKMLTAAALLQLVDQGEVDLEQPITTYLPSLDFSLDPSWAPSMTVQQLLTHSSALHDYLEVDSPLRDDDDLSGYLLGTFPQEQYLLAPAGRFYNYTNPGYMYAGLVTEAVAGEPWGAHLDERVLTPLGMNRTFLLPADVLADGDYAIASTVHWETGEPLRVTPDTYDNAWARPAGYAWSSVLDLAKFVTFLAQGDAAVLSDDLRSAMKSPQVDTEELLDLIHYGYGLMISDGVALGSSFYEMPLLSHGGAIPGFAADLYYVPHCDLGIVTLASTDSAYFIDTVVTAILTLCELPDPSAAPDLAVDPDSFDAYVGDYEDPFNAGPVKLTRVGNELHIEMPLLDQANIPYEPLLVPSSPRNFLLGVQGTQLPLTVILDGAGKGEYLRTRPFVAARQSAVPLSAHTPQVRGLLQAIRSMPRERHPMELLRASR